MAGVFDFEMACVDELALDLGITLLVWTFGAGSTMVAYRFRDRAYAADFAARNGTGVESRWA